MSAETPKRGHGWTTPDDGGTGYICYRVFVPNAATWKGIFRGALLPLMYAENWEKVGTLDPEDCAAICEYSVLKFAENEACMPVGSIIWNVADSLDSYWLPCNGQEVSQATYPELYAVCGTKYGIGTPGNFVLPDLRGRGAVGSGTGSGLTPRSNGQSGGQEVVQLTVPEMPLHNHSYTEHGTAVVVNGELVPESVKSSFAGPATTGNTGGNQPHDNMPPYLVLNPYIRAKP